ncbi:uncharacterized protein KGF55_004585 [Candida pseudojiufengensis]|uniref:uncharacterized protein n=1 Tax=Candida pseudojiufengensis TaxID=497109 RepID=UPI002225817E|nr:uncharacterized protein KGF55_004585 [Candida pseudojiufengensis]KAI5960293.1 hypothetical protein KGF55_004585 [Candida pseudojiufengensis]
MSNRAPTGEKAFFCPIPECEKHFTRADALTKHRKGAHNLQNIKDQLQSFKDSYQGVENITEDKYRELIQKDYELKLPWWYDQQFINLLTDENITIDSIPFDLNQYKLSNLRIKHILETNEDNIQPDPNNQIINIVKRQIQYEHPERVMNSNNDRIIENLSNESKQLIQNYKKEMEDDLDLNNKDLTQLKQLHDKLQSRLNTSLKINKIITNNLQSSIITKRKIWLKNQILIDANLKIGLPPEPSSIPQRVIQDKYDVELLKNL